MQSRLKDQGSAADGDSIGHPRKKAVEKPMEDNAEKVSGIAVSEAETSQDSKSEESFEDVRAENIRRGSWWRSRVADEPGSSIALVESGIAVSSEVSWRNLERGETEAVTGLLARRRTQDRKKSVRLPDSVPDGIPTRYLRNLLGQPNKLLKTLLIKGRNAPVVP